MGKEGLSFAHENLRNTGIVVADRRRVMNRRLLLEKIISGVAKPGCKPAH